MLMLILPIPLRKKVKNKFFTLIFTLVYFISIDLIITIFTKELIFAFPAKASAISSTTKYDFVISTSLQAFRLIIIYKSVYFYLV